MTGDPLGRRAANDGRVTSLCFSDHFIEIKDNPQVDLVVDLHIDTFRTRSLPSAQLFFIFIQFLGKFGRIICFVSLGNFWIHHYHPQNYLH